MLKLTEPTTGTIAFDGAALGGSGRQPARLPPRGWLVFQNPFDALNPRFTIYRAVANLS
jgi:ABC-type glutathione transport system ATPase component